MQHTPDGRAALTTAERAIDARFRAALARLPRQGPAGWFTEFVVFGLKQAWACVFGAAMLAIICAAHLWYPDDAAFARNDALTVAAVAIQVAMVAGRLESLRELRVIVLFHLVGTVMELFKTHVGSWTYEPEGVLRLGGVPLFSGFMYAAVGSYLVRVNRLFDLRFTRYPRRWLTALVGTAIYVNFFTNHYLPDVRWLLVAAVALVFGPCVMHFRIFRARCACRCCWPSSSSPSSSGWPRTSPPGRTPGSTRASGRLASGVTDEADVVVPLDDHFGGAGHLDRTAAAARRRPATAPRHRRNGVGSGAGRPAGAAPIVSRPAQPWRPFHCGLSRFTTTTRPRRRTTVEPGFRFSDRRDVRTFMSVFSSARVSRRTPVGTPTTTVGFPGRWRSIGGRSPTYRSDGGDGSTASRAANCRSTWGRAR